MSQSLAEAHVEDLIFAEHVAKVIDLATKSADLVPKALLALGALAKLFGA